MSKLTKVEAAWLAELQEVMDRCPSKRLGFFTTGDSSVSVYDRKKDGEINALMEAHGSTADFGPAVDKCSARLGWVDFPAPVHSTSG